MDSPNLDISYQGNIRGHLSLVVSIYYVFMVVLFFFWTSAHSLWDSFPNQGLNLCSLHWKRGTLTTGPPGKSLVVVLEMLKFLGSLLSWIEQKEKAG